MKKAISYWMNNVSGDAVALRRAFQRNHNGNKETVLIAFLGALAAAFQSAGGFLPGIGFLISPFAAAPVQLGTINSFRCGAMSYGVAIVMLLIMQPSELVIFPFTTGVLGIFTGVGLINMWNRIGIVLAGAIGLFTGLVVVLYGLQFPVLGPAASVSSFQVRQLAILCLFCFVYSWLWLELSLTAIRKIRRILEMG